MSIGRAQIEEQIKGFSGGGASVANNVTGNMTDQEIQAALDLIRQSMGTQPSQPQTFDQTVSQYKERLAPILGTSTRPSFFDLASDLGSAMLAAPADTGAFKSMGMGFAQFNERMKKQEEERRQIDQQVGLKAFELARDDEQRAEDYLNQRAIKALEIQTRAPKYETYEYDFTDPVTGKTERRTATLNENSQGDMALIYGSKGPDGQVIPPALPNAQKVKTPGVSVNMGGQSTFATKQGESLSKSIDEISAGYAAARSQSDLINHLNLVISRLDDNVGLLEQVTLGPRKILQELGIRFDENIGDQELLQTLGTRLAMQLVGQTKGAISNAEMNLFIAASPTLSSSREGLIKQADYLNRIAILNEKLFTDFNNDLALADRMQNARNDAEANRIFNAWRAEWDTKNSFLSAEEKAELRKFAAQESELAIAYRKKLGGTGDFDYANTDATKSGY